MAPAPPFKLTPGTRASPVVLAVPHAGREYPAALLAALRLPLRAVAVLEDRHVDAVAQAAHGGETLIVQRRPRAWIDLNRAENERDPAVDEGAERTALPMPSAKLRSGLGLVPRRIAAGGDLWRRRWTGDEIDRRIAEDHRPYHAAVAAALAAARARFGTAVLLDVHSMPPLPGKDAARLVIGDRFGRAAAGRFVHRIEEQALAARVRPALNAPYAGGYTLERHGSPTGGIHAVQIELDRSLYLDAALDAPGPGLPATAALLRAIIDAVADEALNGLLPDAAALAAE